MRLPRPLYIALRFAEALGSAGSRLFNAAILGGSTHQSTSARAHIESYASDGWATARTWINRVFFWQADHCRMAWEYEVAEALNTLERNGAIPAA